MMNKHFEHSEVLLSLYKKNWSVLPSDDTNNLQKQPKLKKPKTIPIKKRSPKLINSLNILNQRINKLEHTNIRITNMIILIQKGMSQVQVATKIILILKIYRLKHTNRRRTTVLQAKQPLS